MVNISKNFAGGDLSGAAGKKKVWPKPNNASGKHEDHEGGEFDIVRQSNSDGNIIIRLLFSGRELVSVNENELIGRQKAEYTGWSETKRFAYRVARLLQAGLRIASGDFVAKLPPNLGPTVPGEPGYTVMKLSKRIAVLYEEDSAGVEIVIYSVLKGTNVPVDLYDAVKLRTRPFRLLADGTAFPKQTWERRVVQIDGKPPVNYYVDGINEGFVSWGRIWSEAELKRVFGKRSLEDGEFVDAVALLEQAHRARMLRLNKNKPLGGQESELIRVIDVAAAPRDPLDDHGYKKEPWQAEFPKSMVVQSKISLYVLERALQLRSRNPDKTAVPRNIILNPRPEPLTEVKTARTTTASSSSTVDVSESQPQSLVAATAEAAKDQTRPNVDVNATDVKLDKEEAFARAEREIDHDDALLRAVYQGIEEYYSLSGPTPCNSFASHPWVAQLAIKTQSAEKHGDPATRRVILVQHRASYLVLRFVHPTGELEGRIAGMLARMNMLSLAQVRCSSSSTTTSSGPHQPLPDHTRDSHLRVRDLAEVLEDMRERLVKLELEQAGKGESSLSGAAPKESLI